jgi:class 3 adenylate cyclase
VLFTDVVGSTERAATLGDRDWKSLLDRHDEVLRNVLARNGGVEVDTAGDGMLSTFDSPARAVRCARATVCEASPRARCLTLLGGPHPSRRGLTLPRTGAANRARRGRPSARRRLRPRCATSQTG